MSRHWNPNFAKAGRPRSFRPRRGSWRRQRGFSIRDLLVFPIAMAAGIVFAAVSSGHLRLPHRTAASESSAPSAAYSDPYAEARRSRTILSAQEGEPPPAMRPSGGTVSATRASQRADPGLVRIVDGDTFVYRGERIRVADIDTPEVAGRCPYESALAARATARMRVLIAAGPFELSPGGDGRDEDRYGRKLRIVSRGGRSLGQVLVSEGLARQWIGHRQPWC